MDWHAHVEAALANGRAAGRMTRREANDLHRHLDKLAFNMTVAGQQDAIPKAVAAFWTMHVQTRYLGTAPRVPSSKQIRAAKWWALAMAAGLLCERARALAFVDRSLQQYFCLHFCHSHGLDARLLRLAARQSFAEIWRQWAEQDPSLVERLIVLVRDAAEPSARAHAALALGYLGQPQVVAPLLAALGDPSNRVRINATQALAAFGDPHIMDQLAANLVHAEHPLRPKLSEALGSAGEPAVPVLIELLAHPDWLVQRAAVIGLARTGSSRAVEPLLTFNRGSTSDMVTEGHVIDALATLGEAAVLPLIETLDADGLRQRERARRALGRIGYANAAIPLLARLKEERRRAPSVHAWEIGQALINQSAPQNTDLFLEALAEPDVEVRLYAALALGRLGDTRAFEPLLALLTDHVYGVGASVVEMLGKLGDRRAVEPLIRELGKADVRTGMAVAEGKLGDAIAFERVSAIVLSALRSAIARALGKLGDARAIEPLLALLTDQDRWVAGCAAEALIKLGATPVVEPLLETLHQSGASTPASVIHVLGKLGGKRVVEPLLALLSDPALLPLLSLPAPPSGDVIATVLTALGDLRDPRAVEPILSLLQTLGAGTKRLYLHYQGQYYGEPLNWAIWAIRALGDIGDPRAIDALLSLIGPRSDLNFSAITALTQIVDQRTLDGLRRIQSRSSANLSPRGQDVLLSLFGPRIERAIKEMSRRLDRQNVKHLSRKRR